LEFYMGANWREIVMPSAQAVAYCDRMKQLSVDNPILLLAYVHSMYLALLAGGQIIKRIVRRTLGLEKGSGLCVFEFDDSSRLDMKRKFMDSINRLPLSREDKEAIIEEKVIVFRMNNLIVEGIRPTLINYKRLAQFTAIAAIGLAIAAYGFIRFIRG